MKMVLFDLGNTLEEIVNDRDVLLPGARETLEAVRGLKDAAGEPPLLALVSDFGPVPATPAQAAASREEYLKILDALGIRGFFEPVASRVTISAETGATKPKKKIFQRVIRKVPGLRFEDVIFITEEPTHVAAAWKLKMRAVHFKGPGQTSGDISRLMDFIPLVQKFLVEAH
jgi:FMN phosphatase YigB (HAD superfamily)